MISPPHRQVRTITFIIFFFVGFYFKATLYYNTKKVKTVKSPGFVIRRNTSLYNVNRDFSFLLSTACCDELIVVLSIMEKSLLRHDTLVGKYTLGPHLQSFDQQTTLWGKLGDSEKPVTAWVDL